MAIHNELLLAWSRAANRKQRAVADNCRFDERALHARWQEFGAILNDVTHGATDVSWDDWVEGNRRYVRRYFRVPSDNTPSTFLPVNQPARLDDVFENQCLVRMEVINRPLDRVGLTLKNLRMLTGQATRGNVNALAIVERFCVK